MKLKIGDKAPVFTALNQDGQEISLKNLLGRKVVLYFYPKDNTPTCTIEACNLRDNYQKLQNEGFEVFGISTDSINSHKKFSEKLQLPFDLLEDENQELVKLYDVWGEKKTFGKQYMGLKRTTFLINEEGFITNIIENVKAKEHSSQILNEDYSA